MKRYAKMYVTDVEVGDIIAVPRNGFARVMAKTWIESGVYRFVASFGNEEFAWNAKDTAMVKIEFPHNEEK